MEIITQNARETKGFGSKVGNNIGTRQKALGNGAKILALSGDLGSGKTTFVQGLAKSLGISQRIISPTFIILRKYETRDTKNEKEKKRISSRPLRFTNFYHIDLYRLEDNIGQEFENLGINEIFSDPKNLVAIEWAEKAKEFMPESTTWIKFENRGGDKRKITVE